MNKHRAEWGEHVAKLQQGKPWADGERLLRDVAMYGPSQLIREKTAAPKLRKYRNQPQVIDGERFDSKKEAHQHRQLLLRQGAGQIRGLQRQVPYPMAINGVEICTYFADWTYWENDRLIVRDCKGVKTKEYLLKKRLLLALYGLEILES